VNAVTRSLITVHTAAGARTRALLERVTTDDRGQASAEYAGIIFVIVAIIAAVVGAAGGIGDAIGAKIEEAVGNIGG